jgi:hypothetical protein
MEILGPYPNTSPRKASVFAPCAYIRVQSDGLWRIVVHPWSGEWGNFRSRHPGVTLPISRVQQTIHAPVIGSCQDSTARKKPLPPGALKPDAYFGLPPRAVSEPNSVRGVKSEGEKG